MQLAPNIKGCDAGDGNVTGVELLADKNAQGKNSANRTSWAPAKLELGPGGLGKSDATHAKYGKFCENKKNHYKLQLEVIKGLK